MRLWVGFFLLVGSLLLAVPLLFIGAYLPPLLLLLLLPGGGLLLGAGLIVSNPGPVWAKLLALSPVLGPVLLVLAMEVVPPAANHLVFLLPSGMRGSVTVYHAPRNDLSARVDGHILLEVEDKYSLYPLEIAQELVASDLAEADYYVVDAQGQRLQKLPRLTAQAFAQPTQGAHPSAPADPRQVGVFGTEASRQLPTLAAGSLFGTVRNFWANPYHKVEQLTFTVACYDSLHLSTQPKRN